MNEGTGMNGKGQFERISSPSWLDLGGEGGISDDSQMFKLST